MQCNAPLLLPMHLHLISCMHHTEEYHLLLSLRCTSPYLTPFCEVVDLINRLQLIAISLYIDQNKVQKVPWQEKRKVNYMSTLVLLKHGSPTKHNKLSIGRQYLSQNGSNLGSVVKKLRKNLRF